MIVLEVLRSEGTTATLSQTNDAKTLLKQQARLGCAAFHQFSAAAENMRHSLSWMAESVARKMLSSLIRTVEPDTDNLNFRLSSKLYSYKLRLEYIARDHS